MRLSSFAIASPAEAPSARPDTFPSLSNSEASVGGWVGNYIDHPGYFSAERA